MNKKPLKITLDINSDDELRQYVKDAIDNQVKSIVRNEFKDMISAHLAAMASVKIPTSALEKQIEHIAYRLVDLKIKQITKEELLEMYLKKHGGKI